MDYSTKTVSFPITPKENLSGILYVPQLKKQKFPAVLILHGRGSRKERYLDRAEILAQNGFLTLVFDFRGCGGSDGDFKNQTIKKRLPRCIGRL